MGLNSKAVSCSEKKNCMAVAMQVSKGLVSRPFGFVEEGYLGE